MCDPTVENKKRAEIFAWSVNRLINTMQGLQSHQTTQLENVIKNLREVTSGFRGSSMMPADQVQTYKQVLLNLVPILFANLANELLTKQIFNLFLNSINVLSVQAVPIITQVISESVSKLPYPRLLDLIRILAFSVDTFKENAIPILQQTFPNILQ